MGGLLALPWDEMISVVETPQMIYVNRTEEKSMGEWMVDAKGEVAANQSCCSHTRPARGDAWASPGEP